MKTAPRDRRIHRLQIAARGVAVALVIGWFGLKLVPLPPALLQPPPVSRELTDRHGVTLRELRTEERFAREVALTEVPPQLMRAMLAAEDKRFFQHGGLDPLATARALWNNATHRRVTSGASTITQQLVKNAAPRRRTLWAKCVEAATALRLEQVWTKEQILAAYLNGSTFGNLNVGIAAATNHYFAKPLADLSVTRRRRFAGLPKNPTRLNPHRSFTAAKTQAGDRARANGTFGVAKGSRRARAGKLRLQPPQRLFRAAFCRFRAARFRAPGSNTAIATTLDLDLNRFVEATVREQLERLRRKNVRARPRSWCRQRERRRARARRPARLLRARHRPGEWRVGAAPGRLDAEAFHLLARARGWRDTGERRGRCARAVSNANRLFPAGELQPPLLRPDAAPPGTGKFAEHPGGARAVVDRRRAGAARAAARVGNDDVGTARRGIRARADDRERGDALDRTGQCVCDAGADGGVEAVAGGERGERSTLNGATGHVSRGRLARRGHAQRQRGEGTGVWGRSVAAAVRFPSRGVEDGDEFDFRDNWERCTSTPECTGGVWRNFAGSPMREVSGVTGAAPILHAVASEKLHARFGGRRVRASA